MIKNLRPALSMLNPLLFLLVSLFALTACGGGGGGDSDANNFTPATSQGLVGKQLTVPVDSDLPDFSSDTLIYRFDSTSTFTETVTNASGSYGYSESSDSQAKFTFDYKSGQIYTVDLVYSSSSAGTATLNTGISTTTGSFTLQ